MFAARYSIIRELGPEAATKIGEHMALHAVVLLRCFFKTHAAPA